MSIILASGSPRRRELLGRFLGNALVIRPARGEELPPPGATASETVRALALAKAREVAALSDPGDTVIAADTVVVLDGAILGKPRDEAEARQMLRALSGRQHAVCTGLAVLRDGETLTAVEETAVRFRTLSDREITAYIATGEPMDKAGAYGIQGYAALFAEAIEGDYFNVMGLPLCTLGRLLRQIGIELL